VSDKESQVQILHHIISYENYLGKFTGGSKPPTKIPRSRSLSSNFFMKGWSWKYNEIRRIRNEEFYTKT
jgi:hypothetical protein